MKTAILTALLAITTFGSAAMATPQVQCRLSESGLESQHLAMTFLGAEGTDLSTTRKVIVQTWTQTRNPDYKPNKHGSISNTDPQPFEITNGKRLGIDVTGVASDETIRGRFLIQFAGGGLSVQLEDGKANLHYDEPAGPEFLQVIEDCTFSDPEVAGITAGN